MATPIIQAVTAAAVAAKEKEQAKAQEKEKEMEIENAAQDAATKKSLPPVKDGEYVPQCYARVCTLLTRACVELLCVV